MPYSRLLTAQAEVSMTDEGLSHAGQPRAGQSRSSNGGFASRPAAEEQATAPGLGPTMPGQLTPSDLVLLQRMPRYEEELDGVVRVQVRAPVDSKDAIRSAVAVAMLANEAAGALRLEVDQKKVFFGLVTRATLWIHQAGRAAQWPPGSIEASLNEKICGEEFQRIGGAFASVSDTIYGWIGKPSPDPWARAMQRIMDSMVTRGLLDRVGVPKRVLKLYTVTLTHHVLPERTADLVMRQLAKSDQRLLETCQQDRPDVHDQLLCQIGSGFSRRAEIPT